MIIIAVSSCSKPREHDRILGIIIPVALDLAYNQELDGQYFIFDSVAVGNLFNYSLEILIDEVESTEFKKNLERFRENYNFNNGSNWIEEYEPNNFSFGYENKETAVGVFSVTEPHFINTNTALLYFELHCGKKCGEGVLFKLHKSDSQWSIIDAIEVWGGSREY